ncbi:MAG: hypothetical protein MSC30_14795 [Gaiellaceae bacterium MAG52_C11]|nr:hypothetical protein [Candidatus Gaiellasilicea maunaloa]
MRAALEQLEDSVIGSAEPGPTLWAPLAYLAGLGVEQDAEERYSAFRRAELLLATGGDPRRPVELADRAVETVADDLATPERRAELAARLGELGSQVEGLPAVSEALRLLGSDHELAWRVYAWALLAEHVAGEG